MYRLAANKIIKKLQNQEKYEIVLRLKSSRVKLVKQWPSCQLLPRILETLAQKVPGVIEIHHFQPPFYPTSRQRSDFCKLMWKTHFSTWQTPGWRDGSQTYLVFLECWAHAGTELHRTAGETWIWEESISGMPTRFYVNSPLPGFSWVFYKFF